MIKKMKKIFISSSTFALFCLPILSFAQQSGVNIDYIDSLINGGTTIIRRLVTFLIGLAVVWFIWNVVRYAMSEDEGGKAKAKEQMIHGIIAIAVCVSIWGLVEILKVAFVGGNSGTAPTNQDLDSMIPGGAGFDDTDASHWSDNQMGA